MSWLIYFSLALLFLIVAVRYFLLIITVQGQSMLPTLEPDERVLVWRHWPARWLRHNQIVVLRPPTGLHSRAFPLFIKRLTGLPGETITAQLTDLPDAWRERKRQEFDAVGRQVWHIPPCHYFVRADSVGTDSLIWGPLPLTSLVGVVIARLPRKSASQTATTIPDSPLLPPSTKQ